MKGIREDYSETLKYLQFTERVLTAARHLKDYNSASIKQLHGSSKSLFVGALWGLGDKVFTVVCADDALASEMAHDLTTLLGADSVSLIQGASKRKSVTGTSIIQQEEIDALLRLRDSGRSIVCMSASAIPLRLPEASNLDEAKQTIRRNEELNFEDFSVRLSLNGYERTDYVGKPGELAVRGGIIDVFAMGWNNPLRFEFWGDVVDSIREFEPLSQRSIREHEEVTLLTKVFHEDDEALTSSILDHIPTDAILVVVEPEAVEAEIHRIDESFDFELLKRWSQLLINAVTNKLDATLASSQTSINASASTAITASTAAQPSFGGSIEQLLKTSASLLSRGNTLLIGADGAQNIKRIRELCEGIAEEAASDEDNANATYFRAISETEWHSTSLSGGFVWHDVNLACFSEHQVFGRQRAQKRTRKSESGISLRELQALHRGDYVVHEDKGIGQFDGLRTIEINGSHVDCVKLLFAGTDVLYVHLNYVHKLSKYSSEEGASPKLSKLGTAEWERKKARAKGKIKDIARDLIKLYAKRKSMPGYAFPTDTVWQNEFEAMFQYEDTPDQARTTAEVKADMEQPTPMDRLVCGDVGFGKTEIAIRAAFKAAQSGKQVAVLVPTTILAQQHYVTFVDRLHRYPISIEVLSRFKSKGQQKEIIERLAQGKVDIVIGTHRLLSKDVVFRQLGLLVIDEEHRFGVSAKEKLRALRAAVDTLTLTATPIPRTLNFSLMGARDLSIIETPPRNRLPIRTEILEWSDDTLREALLLELERGGQAFVVTDKIGDMDKLRMRIQMLVPALRVGLAHGQMPTEELEDVMEHFLERKTDVLIATKIVESGLDIPNANTIIVNNADNFGLAELYQLRGRVGRSNIQAYCYLVVPPVHTLTRVALRRLQALEEFTDLGSGFQLAMRDLEIRGAGNLLGGEQSGFIVEMGFELYQKIIEEAMQELREEEFADVFAGHKHKRPSFVNEDVAIEMDVDTLLPASYIPTDTDRYDAYKRLYNSHNDAEVEAVFAELRDRFGALPDEAENLLFAVRLRIAALPTGFVRVSLVETQLTLEYPPETDTKFYNEAFQVYLPLVTERQNARFSQKGKRLFIEIQLARRDDAITAVRTFADALQAEPAA